MELSHPNTGRSFVCCRRRAGPYRLAGDFAALHAGPPLIPSNPPLMTSFSNGGLSFVSFINLFGFTESTFPSSVNSTFLSSETSANFKSLFLKF